MFLRFCLIVAVWLFAPADVVRSQPIIIGYTNCLAVTNYSQSLVNQAAQSKWFFTHASVGSLMLEGITNLHQSSPAFYQLQATAVTNTPPAATTNGFIYDDSRGHITTSNFFGDWQYSVATFETAVSNGWHYPVVNQAMNILSFVNIWYNNSSNGVAALLDGYVGSMTNLEAAFPQTVFVYVTMPITTTNYGFEIDVEPADDYWRGVFNDRLRAWCRANNRVLFDVADIEAHDTNGTHCTFSYQGQNVEQLWSGNNIGGDACCSEIGDGAHPTSFGVEAMLARGFYALAAGLAAGSHSAAVVTATENGSVRLNCTGTRNVGCVLQRSTNLAGGWNTVLTTNMPACGSFQWVDNFADLDVVPTSAYYRMLQP